VRIALTHNCCQELGGEGIAAEAERHPSHEAQMQEPEEAARGAAQKLTPLKWLLIRVADGFLSPLVWLKRVADEAKRPSLPGEIRKILVVMYHNLGDMVLILPFLQNLRANFPEATITLAVSPKVLELLQAESLADQFIPLRVPWVQHFARWKKYNPFSPLWADLLRSLLALRRQHFDLAFTGMMDIRDNFLVWLMGARQRVGYGFTGGRQFLTDVVKPDPRRPHRSEVWLRLLEYLGKPVSPTLLALHLTRTEQTFARRFLEENGIQPYHTILGIHAGARIAINGWGEQNFAAVEACLLSDPSIRTIWFLQPGERPLQNASESHATLARLPLREFMAVLAHCHVLLCNDGGQMHMATALGVPVVAVFGPTQPAWFGPQGRRNRVVIRPEFWCRPCFGYCIFKQPHCLRCITPDDVLQAVHEVLKELRQTYAVPQVPNPSAAAKCWR
jgi:heptosyltransferase-2